MATTAVRAEIEPDAPPIEPYITVRWYGQSFVYLVSSTGLRVAIDPFDNKKSTYPIPEGQPVDIILASNEDSDHNNTDIFSGTPMCFRSATAEGKNNGNGVIFEGIVAYQDESQGRYKGRSNIYVFTLDDVRFAHLGALGQKKLTPKQVSDIGRVDVLFVPVGLGDFSEVITQLKPKIIFPIHYKTPFTRTPLYPLDDFLKGRKIRAFDSNEARIPARKIPFEQETWVLKSPSGKDKP